LRILGPHWGINVGDLAGDLLSGRKLIDTRRRQPSGYHALLFFGDLPSSSCRQSSILIDAMWYSLPLTSLSLL
jgi:hypothetical protein